MDAELAKPFPFSGVNVDPSQSEAQPPRPHTVERLIDIRGLLGLLLAGFAGAANLVGLRSAELAAILRHQGILVGLASVLLLGALICAISSIFTEMSYPSTPLDHWRRDIFPASHLCVCIYVVRIPKTQFGDAAGFLDAACSSQRSPSPG
ncbi:hypothetical protein [Streptomyces sp. NRRL S-337]|uniref:hypothetical protein n=1 Tax=Streptomyces sp. NRRL S-337 TaxID=1463900 RepID=UPI00131DAA17|nr:hypothetical protein [Streptomyces sp. NRRL S-337]